MKNDEKLNKIKQLPKNTVEEIVEGINSIGELDISVNVARQRLKPDQEFVFYFLTNMDSLISDPEITKQDIAVLMKYAAKMQYGNQISIAQADIAEDLGIDKSNVSKSVRKLTQKGVFLKDRRSLVMNWKYLAKGNLTDFIKAEREKTKVLKSAGGFTSLHFLFFLNSILLIVSNFFSM